MLKFKIYFNKVEHDGDLKNYLTDIKDSDGSIVNSSINFDDKTAIVTVKVDDYNVFKSKFKRTEAFYYSCIHLINE